MSLIPSESQNFPDDFSRAISRARVLHETKRFVDANKPKQPRRPAPTEEERPQAEQAPPPPVIPEEAAPARVENIAPAEPDRIEPEQSRAFVPPPPLTRRLSPLRPVKTSAKGAAKRPVQARLAKSRSAEEDSTEVGPATAPAPVAEQRQESGEEESEAEMVSDQLLLDFLPPAHAIRKRRKRRLVAFCISEAIALIILGACVYVAFFHRIDAQLAAAAIDVGTITAAFAVAVLPILFFAIPSKLP